MISYLNHFKKFTCLLANPITKIHTHCYTKMNPQQIVQDAIRPAKRTKTVCTIGPATQSPQAASRLIDEGLSVARLNFSHGDHQEHRRQMEGVQQAMKLRPNSHVAIMLDTKGPQIRTGNNQQGKPIFLKKGQSLQITTDYSFLGNSKRIACSYQNLVKATGIGKQILIADGSIVGIVKSIDKGIVTIQVQNDGKIGNKKNMCLPGCKITLPTITQLDAIDIIDFGLKYKVDQIAVSFSRRGKDLAQLRQMLIRKDPIHGRNIHLIGKIQNHQGITNLDEIIAFSDGIMIARGDLGMELPLQKVVMAQKYIIDKVLKAGKYTITATQMLESMEVKSQPTRAEVADVTNSIFDLSDATMLSGETTGGHFPFEAAGFMKKIAQEVEHFCDYQKIFNERKLTGTDFYAMGPIALSFTTRCDLIFVTIRDNYKIIQRLAAWRPKAFIIVFTQNPVVKSALAVTFGVHCLPPLKSNTSSRRQIFQDFLQTYGDSYQQNGILPSRALFLNVNEQKGHIEEQQSLHI